MPNGSNARSPSITIWRASNSPWRSRGMSAPWAVHYKCVKDR